MTKYHPLMKDPIYYETYKESPVTYQKSTRKLIKRPNLKSRFDAFIKKLEGKKAKKLTKAERILLIEQRKRAILGIGLLLVVVSITFSTYVTITFVDSSAVFAALAPQVAFALVSLFKAFSKIYK